MSSFRDHTPFPPKASVPSLTSVWEKDGLALRLNIWLTGVWGRQRHPSLAGMELAVDLGTGPGQSLTMEGSKGGIRRELLTSSMLLQTPYHMSRSQHG